MQKEIKNKKENQEEGKSINNNLNYINNKNEEDIFDFGRFNIFYQLGFCSANADSRG